MGRGGGLSFNSAQSQGRLRPWFSVCWTPWHLLSLMGVKHLEAWEIKVFPAWRAKLHGASLSLLLPLWCVCFPPALSSSCSGRKLISQNYLAAVWMCVWSIGIPAVLISQLKGWLLCTKVSLVFQSKVGGGGRRRGGQRHKVKSQGACVTPASGCWISYSSSLWGIPPIPFISYPKDPEQHKPKPIPADWLQKNCPSSLQEVMERNIIYKLMKVIRQRTE